MRPLCLLALLALAPSLCAAPIFAPKAAMDLQGGYNSVDGVDGSGSLTGSFKLTPAWIWLQGPSLALGLQGSLSGQQQALEENTLFSRSASLGSSVDWTQPVGPGRMPLRVEATRSYSARTTNEPWGKGLYDWEQYTASTGYRQEGDDWKGMGSLFAGHRSYPNYRDRSAVLQGGKGYYFKDYDYAGGNASWANVLGAGWSGELKYNLELRQFGDAYLVGKDGTTDLGTRQAEAMHTVSVDAARIRKEDEFGWQLQALWTVLDSNQGSFDAGNNIFIASADSFDATGLGAKLVWNAFHRVPGLAMDLMGGIQNRHSRLPIRGRDGSYAKGLQSDLSYSSRLGATYNLLPWGFSLLATAELARVTSNQQYAAAGSPEYTLFNINAGLSWGWSRY